MKEPGDGITNLEHMVAKTAAEQKWASGSKKEVEGSEFWNKK